MKNEEKQYDVYLSRPKIKLKKNLKLINEETEDVILKLKGLPSYDPHLRR